jgi:hypothetical protein
VGAVARGFNDRVTSLTVPMRLKGICIEPGAGVATWNQFCGSPLVDVAAWRRQFASYEMCLCWRSCATIEPAYR